MKNFIAMFISICAITGCTTSAVTETVTGTISYRERIALPPQAEIIVTLEDTSFADIKSNKINEVKFSSKGKQVPFTFDIGFDRDQINPNHHYVIRAKIKLNGQLIYTSDTVYQVITDKNHTHDVNVLVRSVK